jgi:hypothetical protein
VTNIRWTFTAIAFVFLAAPASTVAQQPIRIGATTALTGEASIQGRYVREGHLFCQRTRMRKAEFSGLGLSW